MAPRRPHVVLVSPEERAAVNGAFQALPPQRHLLAFLQRSDGAAPRKEVELREFMAEVRACAAAPGESPDAVYATIGRPLRLARETPRAPELLFFRVAVPADCYERVAACVEGWTWRGPPAAGAAGASGPPGAARAPAQDPAARAWSALVGGGIGRADERSSYSVETPDSWTPAHLKLVLETVRRVNVASISPVLDPASGCPLAGRFEVVTLGKMPAGGVTDDIAPLRKTFPEMGFAYFGTPVAADGQQFAARMSLLRRGKGRPMPAFVRAAAHRAAGGRRRSSRGGSASNSGAASPRAARSYAAAARAAAPDAGADAADDADNGADVEEADGAREPVAQGAPPAGLAAPRAADGQRRDSAGGAGAGAAGPAPAAAQQQQRQQQQPQQQPQQQQQQQQQRAGGSIPPVPRPPSRRASRTGAASDEGDADWQLSKAARKNLKRKAKRAAKQAEDEATAAAAAAAAAAANAPTGGGEAPADAPMEEATAVAPAGAEQASSDSGLFADSPEGDAEMEESGLELAVSSGAPPAAASAPPLAQLQVQQHQPHLQQQLSLVPWRWAQWASACARRSAGRPPRGAARAPAPCAVSARACCRMVRRRSCRRLTQRPAGPRGPCPPRPTPWRRSSCGWRRATAAAAPAAAAAAAAAAGQQPPA